MLFLLASEDPGKYNEKKFFFTWEKCPKFSEHVHMGQNIHKKTKKNLFKANSKKFDMVRFDERKFGFDFIKILVLISVLILG